MRMCDAHYQLLRQAIKDRGLWSLVSTSGEEAAKRMSGESDKFDPLLGAYNRILVKAVEVASTEIFRGETDEQQVCPICYLAERCSCGRGSECDYFKWITYAADGALAYAQEHKLVPLPS